ncbi:MAG TPA: cation transporter [Chryseolinea sp.]|nr:cation transporter [Chryseolinea sp.]HPM29765.1 cation transporter [Chryseolinea sp.]
METTKFRTNIKCDACIAKVTPVLNETVGVNNWQMDITNPAKVLTVEGKIEEKKMKEALEKVGYKAERI